MNKYAVDQRGGCIAVIRTDIEIDWDGLHPNDCHVIKFWQGYSIDKKTGFMEWDVHEKDVKAAYELCCQLNEMSIMTVQEGIMNCICGKGRMRVSKTSPFDTVILRTRKCDICRRVLRTEETIMGEYYGLEETDKIISMEHYNQRRKSL